MTHTNLKDRRRARFWQRVDQSGGPDACWPWTGHVRPNGYGIARDQYSQAASAHRVALELSGVEIPDGMEVDHRCHNGTDCAGGPQCPHRRCCNPTHLRPVTHRVNQQSSHNIQRRPIMEHTPPDRRTVEHSTLTASQRSQRARIAALARHSRTDGSQATQAARTAFLARFEAQVDPDGRLDPAERTRRAEVAKREHFQRLAYARHRRTA